jgi:hypothetical protein
MSNVMPLSFFCSVSSYYYSSPFFLCDMNVSTADLRNYWAEFHETWWRYRMKNHVCFVKAGEDVTIRCDITSPYELQSVWWQKSVDGKATKNSQTLFGDLLFLLRFLLLLFFSFLSLRHERVDGRSQELLGRAAILKMAKILKTHTCSSKGDLSLCQILCLYHYPFRSYQH